MVFCVNVEWYFVSEMSSILCECRVVFCVRDDWYFVRRHSYLYPTLSQTSGGFLVRDMGAELGLVFLVPVNK